MKEYLLLRNNAELGHYSLDELRSMGLRAYDLIWIENKSFSWKYPSEISELAMFAPPVQIPSFEGADNREGRLVQMTGNSGPVEKAHSPLGGPGADVPATSASSHIVALKPKVDHIRIKTIKSSARSNIVKVEVREETLKENVPFEATVNTPCAYADPVTRHRPAGFIQQPVPQAGGRLRLLDTFYALSNNNKMEMAVLAVGTVSLLAVVYLFITTGY